MERDPLESAYFSTTEYKKLCDQVKRRPFLEVLARAKQWVNDLIIRIIVPVDHVDLP